MASSSSSSKIKQPDEDPYKVLGLEFPVTDDAAITKAYRKLALKLHPDKQQTATPAEADAMALKFHQLQQARAFLLDVEFQASRAAYDRQRASQQARERHEQAQRNKLSNDRKIMQQELAKAEAEAALKKRKASGKTTLSSSSSSKQQRREELRRQGQAMREAQTAAAAQERDSEQAQTASSAAARQVRLKWSRKRVKQSPSEDSIAREFGTKFGPVESVEMIGSKGNAALVTFTNAASCRPCVEFYQNSNEMRATYIIQPTEAVAEQESSRKSAAATTPPPNASPTTNNARDYESVAEWHARRAAARQALAQQDENEHTDATKRSASWNFLPKFPLSNKPFWEQLTALEEEILAPILGQERFQELKNPPNVGGS